MFIYNTVQVCGSLIGTKGKYHFRVIWNFQVDQNVCLVKSEKSRFGKKFTMFKNHWLWFYKILENQFEECRNLATKKIGINSFWIRNCFVMISSSKKSLKTIIFRDLDQYTIFLCFKICDFSNLDWGKLAIPDI